MKQFIKELALCFYLHLFSLLTIISFKLSLYFICMVSRCFAFYIALQCSCRGAGSHHALLHFYTHPAPISLQCLTSFASHRPPLVQSVQSSHPSVWPHLPLNTSTSRIGTTDPSHLQSQPPAFHPGIDSAAHNWVPIACNSLSHIDFMFIMSHLLLVNLFSKFLDDHHRKPRWNCGNRVRDHFVLYHFTGNQTLVHFVIWA